MSPSSAIRGAEGHPGNDLVGRLARFEWAIVPHLDAAYKLALWLTRRAQDAEDVVQEASLRAFQFLGSFHGDERAWLLTIVRNTCCTWLRRNRARQPRARFDPHSHDVAWTAGDPEALLRRAEDAQWVRDALGELPAAHREVIVLRELEGLSYKEIARAVGISQGTVMSRLARARVRLGQLLTERAG
jgi:RNA polymerase sigma-70 factor (ECF subfamily)